MVLAGTGHRPQKIWPDDPWNPINLTQLRARIRKYLEQGQEFQGMRGIISGMALGFDQAFAWAAVDLGIPFVAAVPFEGQERNWPHESQLEYNNLLEKAAKVIHVCTPGYAPWKMQKRNEWMVDKGTALLAFWNGTKGGTSNCVKYARSKNKVIYHITPEILTEEH